VATPGRREDGTNAQPWRRKRRTNRPAQGSVSSSLRRQKIAREEQATPKDVKYEGRSGNVYENKGPDDNFTDKKDDISARLQGILQNDTRILQKSAASLSLF
jgi:hypothetical protein